MTKPIVVLGVFNTDLTFRADRMPRIGETIHGNGFALGPGGKGSNQAVAAARAGGDAHIITRLGRDPFADIALDVWKKASVTPQVTRHVGHTGAAHIFIEEATGDNAIIVAPGVAGDLSPADLDANRALIDSAAVFITQLEQPLDAAKRGLELARAAGVTTILNPAPARDLPDDILALCDVLTPNETETEALTGVTVKDTADAEKAARILLGRGVGAVIVTLGENGALYCDASQVFHTPAMSVGPVVETTGAGDCFNGAFAAAIAEGQSPSSALKFATAAAAISVTRPGAAESMPDRTETDALLSLR